MKKVHINGINNLLSCLVLALAAYIIFMPLVPEVSYAIANQQNSISEKQQRNENTIIIPNIGVDGEILEGNDESILQKGIWRRPISSTPDKGGNTVLVAHRYLYTAGPNTFYHLPKLRTNDTFMLFWKGKKYNYQVIETKVVSADNLEVENDTEDAIVTLYTCTPLWNSKDRFVVIAKLMK